MRRWALLIAVVACGGGGGGAAVSGDEATAADSATAAPRHPEPVRGRLVARAVGAGVLGGSWRARVGQCERPRSLQIASEGDSVDVLLLLWPDSGAPEQQFPVIQRDSAPAQGPHARVGVQRLGYLVASYQGMRGSVTLERLNRTASGRFDLTLREAMTWDTVRYLGTFADLPVEAWSPELCGAAAPDTLAKPLPDPRSPAR